MAMNEVNLTGNIAQDPRIGQTKNGRTTVSFSLAVQRNYKNKQSGDYDTDFPDIQIFGKTADNVGRFLSKGLRIGITGSLRTSSYTDKEGVKRYPTTVVANQVYFLQSAKDSGNKSSQQAKDPFQNNNQNADPFQQNGKKVDIDDSQLPF